jgi:hypothetical protein
MSDYSQQIRERFLSQLALAAEVMEKPDVREHPAIRFHLLDRSVTRHVLPLFCPLTAVCYHVHLVLFGAGDYVYAAEELAIPRGMARAIALAADAIKAPRWRQRCLDWWREHLLASLGVPASAP